MTRRGRHFPGDSCRPWRIAAFPGRWSCGATTIFRPETRSVHHFFSSFSDESGQPDLPKNKLRLVNSREDQGATGGVSLTRCADPTSASARGGRMAPRLRGRAGSPRTPMVGANTLQRGAVYHLAGESTALWGLGRAGEPFWPFRRVQDGLSGERSTSLGPSGVACFTPSGAVVCACAEVP